MIWTLLASMALSLLSIGSANAANEPITGVDVIVRNKADGSVMIETITDGRGAFVVKEMRPGLYSIEAGARLPLALLKRSGGWGISLIPVTAKTASPRSIVPSRHPEACRSTSSCPKARPPLTR